MVSEWFVLSVEVLVRLAWFGRPLIQNSHRPGDILSMKHSFVIPKVAFLMHKIGVFIYTNYY